MCCYRKFVLVLGKKNELKSREISKGKTKKKKLKPMKNAQAGNERLNNESSSSKPHVESSIIKAELVPNANTSWWKRSLSKTSMPGKKKERKHTAKKSVENQSVMKTYFSKAGSVDSVTSLVERPLKKAQG